MSEYLEHITSVENVKDKIKDLALDMYNKGRADERASINAENEISYDVGYEKGWADGRAKTVGDCLTILKTMHMMRTSEEDFNSKIETPFYRELYAKIKELGEEQK